MLMPGRIGTVLAIVGVALAVCESASGQSHSNTNCQRIGNSVNCSTTTQPYVLPGPTQNPEAEAFERAYERARAESEARRQRRHELEMQERQQEHERQMRDRAPHPAAIPQGPFGMNARRDGGFITVTAVRPGSLADRSGLRPGHRLVKVRGQYVNAATPPEELRRLLTPPTESSPAELVILSQDGTQVTLPLLRE